MSVLIFRLNDVSEEEAEAVRELLLGNDLDFYESSPGRWGLSVAGLWLHHDQQKDRARALIDDYQQQRSQQMAQYREHSPPESLLERLKKSPVQFVSYTLLTVFTLFISLSPFIKLLVD
jgi:hypothetical protein